MPLVFAAIAPHGPELVPELDQTSPSPYLATRHAMRELGRRLERHRPDAVVCLTPHGIRIEGAMCISVSERAAGELGTLEWIREVAAPGPRVQLDFAVDRDLARAIGDRSESRGVPVARCIYGGSSGSACRIPLDWGASVPLWFMGHGLVPRPRVVVVCPSRALSREQMVACGRAIGEAAAATDRRVALIASADHGHAHRADGPYGFDPAAAEYDRQMVQAVRDGDLKRLLTTDPRLVQDAKPDSLWQMLILAGALETRPMRGELLCYEVPTYYGMICAAYEPA